MIRFLHSMGRRDADGPQWTKEQEKNLFLVYRYSEEAGRYDFYTLHDAAEYTQALRSGGAEEYAGDCIGVPITSIGFVKGEEVPVGTIFKNVSGSSKDPHIGSMSWVTLVYKFNQSFTCCTDGCFYVDPYFFQTDRETAVTVGGTIYKCQDPDVKHGVLVGGHIVWGENADPGAKPGSDVYLLPICSLHNTYRFGGDGFRRAEGTKDVKLDTGMGFYMKTAQKVVSVRLIGYLEKAAVEEALRREAL